VTSIGRIRIVDCTAKRMEVPAMAKRFRLIVNPAAGGGTASQAVPTIERMLREHGVTFDLVSTERPWHAAELTRKAVQDGVDVVVAVGGDGTSNEVLNGLMQARQAGMGTAALGVLCVGRGNDFAFAAGVPHALDEGCAALAADHRRMIDVGRVDGESLPEGRFFGNGAGIGFDAVVGFEAAKLKRLRGFPGYLVAALKTIFLYFRAPLTRIEYGGRTIEQESLMISIMNGRRLGGGFMTAPEAEIDDGLFDLCIAGQVSRLGILALIPRFMRGTQASRPSVTTGRAKRITVTALEGLLPAHADGETLCTEGKQLTMEIHPRQIEVVCRRPESGV
jgi:diacylglycerol kinase (ATP)